MGVSKVKVKLKLMVIGQGVVIGRCSAHHFCEGKNKKRNTKKSLCIIDKQTQVFSFFFLFLSCFFFSFPHKQPAQGVETRHRINGAPWTPLDAYDKVMKGKTYGCSAAPDERIMCRPR